MHDFDERAVAIIRGISMDAPHAARSGHQGTAMSLAPLAHVLFSRIMKYDAQHPHWPDRDRFVLSAGHVSILQYVMLYLAGFGLTLDDLRDFRQWGSATPGHPEVGHTPGVEVTTGPLGQGVGNMVGMAIAEAQLRTTYGAELFDHNIFGICSDGDLSEGLSHEVASLAGHMGLGKIVLCYDDNHVTIDGETELALSDDAAARFRSYGWDVTELGEVGEDLDALEAGIRKAMSVADRPSLVIVRTIIGTPAPESSDTPGAHGYVIFDEEIAATKELIGLPPDKSFYIEPGVVAQYREVGLKGSVAREAWQERVAAFDGDRASLESQLSGTGLPGWEESLPTFDAGDSIATRKASNVTLQALSSVVPGLSGGGADLTGNTGTVISDHGVFSAADPGGRQIYFGVREHGMGSIANGMALHGGSIPVVGTFLVFADYMRAAVRLAAISGAHAIFVWSHDSVGVGEDGPTHQPVEQVASLRAIPGLRVIRPADANEAAAAWGVAISSGGPTALILSRQNVPVLEGTSSGNVGAGAYVLVSADDAVVSLVGTGSEVSLCLAAAAELAAEGLVARVVSMPSWELFEQMSPEYRASVISRDIPSLAVEAGSSMGWHRWVDDVVSVDRFGSSAPGDVVMFEYGINPANVAARARALIETRSPSPN
ncbi:MAG: transketolase [Acidimicrobiaceae bacterium]|nr:transketolase [Acidimicrobiaceae bacterium]MYG55619.1 transketolase [Acidimicrobiaceae bacterium]MYJ98687.1 transketolase [Acidimicrobiaceae bacterium]